MNNQTTLDVEKLKGTLKSYLVQFLQEHGINTGEKHIRCFTGTHADRTPSMHLFADNQRVHCFGCGWDGDIFDAARVLDNAPIEGAGFLHDNMFAIARRYGIAVPEKLQQLSEEEVWEQQLYRAYEKASGILTSSTLSGAVTKEIEKRGWSEKTLKELGVGSITSFTNYLDRMVDYGFDPQFLMAADLANPAVFGENRLLFTVRDERGNPVGFASRDLLWKKGKSTAKYVNTTAARVENGLEISNPLYNKSRLLYGFSQARRFAPPLWVFEGYPDATTAIDRGLRNSCAIGGTAFTEEHLEVLFGLNINHIIFCLDADDSGQKNTARFVQMIDEHLGSRPNLRVEILSMPRDTDDPDKFIRDNGLEKFLHLEKADVFYWRLEADLKAGADKHELTKHTLPLIVNEPSNIERDRKIQSLAKATGVARELILNEVMAILDAERSKMEEQKSALANRIARKLQQQPGLVDSILSEARSQMDALQGQVKIYGRIEFVRNIVALRRESQSVDVKKRLQTGWPRWDREIGIPAREAYISVPGKPSHGKTSFFADLTVRLLVYNPEPILLCHTMDDPLAAYFFRVLAAYSGVHINDFRNEGEKLERNLLSNEVREKINDAYRWAENMATEGRLTIAGSAEVPNTIAAAGNWIRRKRRDMPGNPIVYIGDNYHLFADGAGSRDDEPRMRENSSMLKNLSSESKSTIILSMEIPKGQMGVGVRPRIGSIKGSSGMSFDASMNWNVYNDLTDLQERSSLIWPDPHHPERRVGSTGETLVPRNKPVVELNCDKNKIEGTIGTHYFRMDPFISRFEECDEKETELYSGIASGRSGFHYRSEANIAMPG